MNHQDWTTVSWNKTAKSPTDINKKSEISTKKPIYLEKKKDQDDIEILKTEKITMAFKLALQKYRLKAGISQKDLANRLNLPIGIIKDYESGKCEPNGNIIQSIEKIIIADLTNKKIVDVPKPGFLNALRKKL